VNGWTKTVGGWSFGTAARSTILQMAYWELERQLEWDSVAWRSWQVGLALALIRVELWVVDAVHSVLLNLFSMDKYFGR